VSHKRVLIGWVYHGSHYSGENRLGYSIKMVYFEVYIPKLWFMCTDMGIYT
jgi:hypothetical protein